MAEEFHTKAKQKMIIVSKYGYFIYENGNRSLHRLNGLPAANYINDSRWYFVNGLLHRTGNLPAIEGQLKEFDRYYIHGDEYFPEAAKK